MAPALVGATSASRGLGPILEVLEAGSQQMQSSVPCLQAGFLFSWCDASRQVFGSVAGPAALGVGGSVRVAPRTRAPPVATASAAQMDGRQVLPAPALAVFGAVPSLQPNGKFAVGVLRCSSSSGSFLHVCFKPWKTPSSGPALATRSHLPSSSCCSLAWHVTAGSVLSRRSSVASARDSTVPVWLPHTPRPSTSGQVQALRRAAAAPWDPLHRDGVSLLLHCCALAIPWCRAAGACVVYQPAHAHEPGPRMCVNAAPMAGTCWDCAGGACSPSLSSRCAGVAERGNPGSWVGPGRLSGEAHLRHGKAG